VLLCPCASAHQLRNVCGQGHDPLYSHDARTVVAPFKRVSSLETLYRLIRHGGGDAELCREEIHKWGHGGCWAEVRPEHFALLGIKKMLTPQRQV
jgi:hypothetical protein